MFSSVACLHRPHPRRRAFTEKRRAKNCFCTQCTHVCRAPTLCTADVRAVAVCKSKDAQLKIDFLQFFRALFFTFSLLSGQTGQQTLHCARALGVISPLWTTALWLAAEHFLRTSCRSMFARSRRVISGEHTCYLNLSRSFMLLRTSKGEVQFCMLCREFIVFYTLSHFDAQ